MLNFKRIVKYARAADGLCDSFTKGLSHDGGNPYQTKRLAKPFLTPIERAQFLHAYYLAGTFIFLRRARIGNIQDDWADDFLASKSPRELWCVEEFMSWLEMMNTSHLRRIDRGLWVSSACFSAFRASFRKNFQSPGNRGPYPPFASHSLGISSFFDKCQPGTAK